MDAKGFIYLLRKPHVAISVTSRQVPGSAITYTYNLYIREASDNDILLYRLYAYMVSLISLILSLSLFSPYSFLLILASRARTHTYIRNHRTSGAGLPVKSAVRSIDRATPKIVECRLFPGRIQRVK